MSDFRAKIYPIRFPLGLCPSPCWGAYSTPQTLYLYLRGLLLWGERGKEEEKKGREREKGRGAEGRGVLPHPIVESVSSSGGGEERTRVRGEQGFVTSRHLFFSHSKYCTQF